MDPPGGSLVDRLSTPEADCGFDDDDRRGGPVAQILGFTLVFVVAVCTTVAVVLALPGLLPVLMVLGGAAWVAHRIREKGGRA